MLARLWHLPSLGCGDAALLCCRFLVPKIPWADTACSPQQHLAVPIISGPPVPGINALR